ncbi:MAG: FG-GAP repeat domain-containing protein, partial [bacterium]
MVFNIFLILCKLYFKKLAYFPYGAPVPCYMHVFDSDHDGIPELFVTAEGDTGTMVYEHIANNQYSQFRIFGFPVTAIGYGDADTLTDAFGHIYDGSLPYPLGILESKTYNSYPESLVWCFPDTPQYYAASIFKDLDQDGKTDLITNLGRNRIALYESEGDNIYLRKFQYVLPYITGEMTIDDFDGDGLLELVCGDGYGKFYVFENTAIGVDSFQLVWTYQFPYGSAYETAKGNDMDQDGLIEFGVASYNSADWCFTLFETDGNNSYRKIWEKVYHYLPGLLTAGDIECGDIDGDGIDEMVCFGHLVLYVWKCVGPDSFIQIWENSYMGDLCDGGLLVHDLNQNGLGEIVLSGFNWGAQPMAKTYIYEKMPFVSWIYPAKYDTLWANDTVNLRWKLDETVSLESLRLYIAHPLMGCWLVHEGLPQDTTCTFIVPDTQSNMAFKFWVAVHGYLRDDSIVSPPFYIKRRTVIEETGGWKEKEIGLWVSPNPFSEKMNIKYRINDDQKSGISLKI